MSRGQRQDLCLAASEDHIVGDQQCIDEFLDKLIKGCLDFTSIAGRKYFHLPAHRRGRCLRVFGHSFGVAKSATYEHAKSLASGSSSCRRPTAFVTSSSPMLLKPVILPPGRLKLA